MPSASFPIYVLVDTNDVESSPLPDISKVKSGFGFEMVVYDDKPCALVFTSPQMADEYASKENREPRARVEIRNPHDFVSMFGRIVRSGVPYALFDYSGNDPESVAELGPLLDRMRDRINAKGNG
jgi:hypothetical protein